MYWPHFAPKEHHKADERLSHTDYFKKEMYSPSPKHGSFKDEILEYPTMTKRIYRKLRIKVEEFMKSKKVKALRARFGGWSEHYEIASDDAVIADHLFAVVLYCDCTELCTKMSETFRRLTPEETLDAVKERNRSFWWMSKRLRELIEVFGGNNDDSYQGLGEFEDCTRNKIPGPFFCGVSFVASLSSFCVNLRGPTSSTKQLEVSMNFSGEQGIIITLDNKQFPGNEQKWY